MIDDFDRFIIMEMMSSAYITLEDVDKKIVFLVQQMEGELLNAEGEEDDELDINLLPYLDGVKDLEERKFDCMVQLEEQVESLPTELQEYDFKDDIEYKAVHDGIYKFLMNFEAYARSIIESCLFLDYEATMQWAHDNDYFSEGE